MFIDFKCNIGVSGPLYLKSNSPHMVLNSIYMQRRPWRERWARSQIETITARRCRHKMKEKILLPLPLLKCFIAIPQREIVSKQLQPYLKFGIPSASKCFTLNVLTFTSCISTSNWCQLLRNQQWIYFMKTNFHFAHFFRFLFL